MTESLFKSYVEELTIKPKPQSFFSFFKTGLGYSTTEKIAAAQALQQVLENPKKENLSTALIKLKSHFRALTNGRLNNLFMAYCELAQNDENRHDSNITILTL